MTKLFSFVIFVLTFVPCFIYAGSEVHPISDVDFNYLKSTPSLNWGFNPFAKKPGYVPFDPAEDEVNLKQFKLTAIIYDSRDPLAVINGETVGIGDEVRDAEVEKIGPNYVVLKDNQNHFELTLGAIKPIKRHALIKPVGRDIDDEESD